MSVERYGDHQEAAAAALNRLIVTDTLPVAPVDVDRLLGCREAVSDALRQRLYALGLNRHYAPTTVPARVAKMSLNGLDKKLATILDRIAVEVPALPPDERPSPADVLGIPSQDLTVELWRRAAIELLAGSHALDTAAQRPWLRDPGAGWYLIRDVAVSMEALMVLDSRLEEVGLLNGHNRPETPLGLEERRLITSQCARVATWYATSDSPDQASPELPGEPVVAGPVHTVSQPADLAIAQRRLATYLKPMHAGNSFYNGEPEIDASTARMVVASQIFLTRHFEALAGQAGGDASTIRGEFASRREILQDIQTSIAYLVDDRDRRSNMWVVGQQGELTTAVRRMQRDGVEMRLQPTQLLDLANATHEVTHNAAKALRRELLRDAGNLRLDDPTKLVGPTRVHRRHPLERVLTDMVNVPAPSAPVAQYASPLQRAALRQTLDVTATSRRGPSPYPRARGAATSDYPF